MVVYIIERNKTSCLMNTYHFSAERGYRETLIENLGGAGRVVLTNVIDPGIKTARSGLN